MAPATPGWVYISSTQLLAPEHFSYSVSVIPSHGLYLRNATRVTIDGLAATGFNAAGLVDDRRAGAYATHWGFFLFNSSHCVIRNCLSWMNATGIGLNSEAEGSGGNLIEYCVSWSNASRSGYGDRGGITAFNPRNDEIRQSVAYDNARYGINIYGSSGVRGDMELAEQVKSRLGENLAWGNFCDFKIKTGHGYFHFIENSVGPGLWSTNGDNVSHSLVGLTGNRVYPPSNIDLAKFEDLYLDRQFADPANHDYRLQSDSVFRGAGPDGTDQGPYPFEANVYFVSPDGDDDLDGLSVASAWRTPDRATRDLQAGDTLYFLPGVYDGDLILENRGGAGGPVSLRGRGHAPVVFEGRASFSQVQGLELERLSFNGPVALDQVTNATISNCTFHGHPVALREADEPRLTHNLFYQAPLKLENSSAVYLSGNLFAGTENGAVHLDAHTTIRYAGANTYPAAGPARVVNGEAVSFADLGERETGSSTPSPPVVIRNGVPTADRWETMGKGPHGTPVGRYVRAETMDAPLRLAGPFVHSTGAVSANIEWWTSAPTDVHLAWGKTPGFEEETTVWAHRFSNFSLHNLEPETEYHLQIRLDKPFEHLDGMEAEQENVIIQFTTASADAHAPRTYYVSREGDDQADGASPETAWATVSHAADMVRPGDTVLLAEGTYIEPVRIRVTGEPGRPITFKAKPGAKVLFDGNQRQLDHAFQASFKNHLHFDGFYFRNFVLGARSAPWNDATGRNWNGAFLLYHSDDILITRCFMDGRGAGYSPGLVHAINCRNVTLRNCVVTAAMGAAVSFYGCPELRVEHSVFLRNLISNVSEAVNEPDQPFFLENNLFTDNLPVKAHAPLFSIGKIESFRENNNGYFLRLPDEEKRMFQFYDPVAYNRPAELIGLATEFETEPVFSELTRMGLEEFRANHHPETNSILGDPRFAALAGEEEVTEAGEPRYAVDVLMSRNEIDFPDLFATNPEWLERGIGLQPEAFEDFHFNPQPGVAGAKRLY